METLTLTTMKKNIVFGRKVRRRRTELQLTVTELAAKVGVPQPRITKWESGQGFPLEGGHLLRLCEALEVSLVYLCDDSLTDPESESSIDSMLNDKQKQVWSLVKSLGPDLAFARLAKLPEEGIQPKVGKRQESLPLADDGSGAPVSRTLSTDRGGGKSTAGEMADSADKPKRPKRS